MIRLAEVGDMRKQQRRLSEVAKSTGVGEALFALCAVMNVPYVPEYATDDWGQYLTALESDEEWGRQVLPRRGDGHLRHPGRRDDGMGTVGNRVGNPAPRIGHIPMMTTDASTSYSAPTDTGFSGAAAWTPSRRTPSDGAARCGWRRIKR